MEIIHAERQSDWREQRRLQALDLYEQGWKQQDIAHKLGVSKGSISQWMTRARTQGDAALRSRKPTGAPSRLSQEQKAHLPSFLEQPPAMFGIEGKHWTYARVAAAIAVEWQVSYDPAYVARLLKASGWKPGKSRRITSQSARYSHQCTE